MKVLIVGGGGREHALAWKLNQSEMVKKIYAAPGNAGISQLGECVNIKADDLSGLADFAERNSVDLTLVGPELPLTLGIVDQFEARRLKIFGPSKKASEIEGSKAYAKEFMQKYHIPTASFKIFDDKNQALDFLKENTFPLVIKADGLAAGKGVIPVDNFYQAEETVKKIMVEKIFKEAGSKIVVEDFLEGEEVTIMAFTDGKTVIPMVPSQDHKRIYNGDAGPNTGGMGAYAPTLFVHDRLTKRVYEEILEPTILGLERENRTFKGILYAGLMLTELGPKVMEFNCRFGDPETQVVLPLLKGDLVEIILSIIDGELELENIDWKNDFAVCVIMASSGYPGKYEKGKDIWGLNKIKDDALVFHAGTKYENGRFKTDGGRVLGVTGVESSMDKAISKAYTSVDKIRFSGMQYRRDIGKKGMKLKGKYL
ncbi:MAG: phosphoribosylamine--glycine ligase [candidate division Zixibacteria bacterium SM23_73_2]|nr:MAG: phosphoribosylamine--glycine ligase [candidate division Zixibacteria bacterium SM23_73_2]